MLHLSHSTVILAGVKVWGASQQCGCLVVVEVVLSRRLEEQRIANLALFYSVFVAGVVHRDSHLSEGMWERVRRVKKIPREVERTQQSVGENGKRCSQRAARKGVARQRDCLCSIRWKSGTWVCEPVIGWSGFCAGEYHCMHGTSITSQRLRQQ